MARRAVCYQQEANQLRASGWTYHKIVSYWRERDGLNSLAAFRLAHGMTQADVARRWTREWPDRQTPITYKQISYWELWPGSGGRMPSLGTLDKLAYLYCCSAGDLVDGQDYSYLDPANLDLHRLQPATGASAASRPIPLTRRSKVTETEVEDFEVLTDTYRHLDYRDGAGAVSADVAAHLQHMIEATDRATSGAKRGLLLATGDAAQLAAWLAIDAQDYRRAETYCRLSASLAEKAKHPALQAYSLGVASYIHLHAGNGRAALSILDTAQGIAARTAPAVRSWLREASGEAHGLVNEHRHGLTALAEAERFFDKTTIANTPVWLTFFNADCHAARLKGRCLTRLRRPAAATRALYEALTLLPPTFVRERSGTLIDLAIAYTQLHKIEQACHVATEADQLARRTSSHRNRNRLRQLLVDLMPWTHLECVQNLYRQVLLN